MFWVRFPDSVPNIPPLFLFVFLFNLNVGVIITSSHYNSKVRNSIHATLTIFSSCFRLSIPFVYSLSFVGLLKSISLIINNNSILDRYLRPKILYKGEILPVVIPKISKSLGAPKAKYFRNQFQTCSKFA